MRYPVEIKVNVEATTIDDALGRLGVHEDEAERRSISFYANTDAELPLLKDQGVVLRLRHGHESADVTLKLRPCRAAALPSGWRVPRKDDEGRWEFRIEQDWSGGAEPVLSASLVTELASDVAAAVDGARAADLISSAQSRLFELYTGRPLHTRQLRLLGPVRARKWKVEADSRTINCEEWVIGDQVRFLELSDRETDPEDAASTRQRLLDVCERRGVRINSAAELKTEVVLDYFQARSPAVEV